MSSFLQAEGLCLRYPDKLGQHATINYETAANMLLRAITLSQQVPFVWGFIDKPAGLSVLLQPNDFLTNLLPQREPFSFSSLQPTPHFL
jgi:hypothetical protein